MEEFQCHIKGCGIYYCKDDVDLFDNNNNITGVRYGFERIDSVQLLIEMERYKEGGNFDRLIAFSSCMAIDFYLTSKFITPTKPHINTNSKDQERQEQFKPVRNKFFTNKRRSPFTK